ncbi:TlpA family protein disulfide reductase [Rhizosphaericola mali]|uniref:TlpA family protein disulfide reductase n=1 Tax=Rhizosphaericola mali TaxID=2545455 RepID=A0A5P2FXL6_9BACT|nr:TlpA disulfide reductase family protein [Rhizosphaericola mali]QES88274.1 TlpA family protein disulfide reductase [Rhizosphaericola mali]
MFHKFLFLLFITVSFHPFIHAQTQQKDKNKYLHIGDTIPDFEFAISGYKTKAAKMSDFRGKPVILDLWGVHCSSCISGMPHMEQLQKQFGDSIQIILVTRDPTEQVASLKKRSEILQTVQLPFIVGDNTPAKYFDYTFVPQHIWIDKHGVIRSIANAENANVSNIHKFIHQGTTDLKEKKDLLINSEIPLINFWYPYYKKIGVYSYFTPQQQEYETGSSITKHIRSDYGHRTRISNDAITIQNLYIQSFLSRTETKDELAFSNERIICRIKGIKKYYLADSSHAQFTYDLIADSSISPKTIYRYMQAQLDLFLGAQSHLEKIPRPCFVIKADKSKLHINNGNVKRFSKTNQNVYSAQNFVWLWIKDIITNKYNGPTHQVIDETGIAPNTKMDLVFDMNHWDNLPLLNKELAAYGLSVTLEDRMLDCIVIEDAEE